MTAARHIEEVSGLIMLYPGLAIRDKIHAEFKDWKDCPPVYSYKVWIDVGLVYFRDMWNYDPYEDIPVYDKPILILHGDNDLITPASYSERAASKYENIELKIIKGGGHGFEEDAFRQSMIFIKDYLQEIGLYL